MHLFQYDLPSQASESFVELEFSATTSRAFATEARRWPTWLWLSFKALSVKFQFQ